MNSNHVKSSHVKSSHVKSRHVKSNHVKSHAYASCGGSVDIDTEVTVNDNSNDGTYYTCMETINDASFCVLSPP